MKKSTWSMQSRWLWAPMLMLALASGSVQAQGSTSGAPAGAPAQERLADDGGVAPADAAVPPAADAGLLPEAPAAAPDYQYKLSLEQLGARFPLNLRGVDGSDDVPFSIRADELVTAARLNLTYAYSPALLSDLSHINVLVNNQVAYSIPVPKDTAGRSLLRSIDLPPRLITEFNHLRLQLIGHYTLDCEDPLHSSLWANVSNQSQLELAVQRLSLPEDLSILPLPFYDRRDTRRLVLPFVFASGRDAAVLRSAGMVASWFGALAEYRGAEFPASFDLRYPDKGNAVVFVKGQAAGMAGLDKLTGPTVAVATNPNDANGRLLVVAGRSDEELVQAAQALVTGSKALVGRQAVITQLDPLAARKPYDAPRWIPSDRPVKFGEILSGADLDVAGYDSAPVRLPLRVAPDLFGWHEGPVPIDLRYRYTPQTGSVNSSLLISARDQFLKSYPLLSIDQLADKSVADTLGEGEMLPVEVRTTVPLARLVAKSELEFKFMYDYIKEGQCRDIIIDNVRGRIEPESSLDLSQYPHFMPMPNLAAFSGSGFPYTRMADLSETAVVLADRPTEADVGTYLVLMGRFGESTGLPGTGVQVAFGAAGLQQADKDIVVIASGQQAWLEGWVKSMPALVAGQGKHADTSDRVYKSHLWPTPDPRESQDAPRTDLAYSSEGVETIFAGFESPVTSGRSVVLIASSAPEGQAYAVSALLDESDYEQGLSGSLAAVDAHKISPLVNQYTYSVGELGWWRRIEWTLARYWNGLPAFGRIWDWVGVLLLVILALALWRMMRRRPAAAD
ncbi:cellulose biosynthesis cyclic di-GMP-binding regulatory protein BcsB [Castellaniella defragrans]|nr:cellulose biosynthesis cyclic di-GMP-binding regulatory protein BcsB [Castellaniella defragrans]